MQNNLTSIPHQLIYSQLKPRGWRTIYKQWVLQPNSSSQYWKSNEIVKLLINIRNGYLDPYRSHMQVIPMTNTQMMPVGVLQVDNSAQSFFSQCVISSYQRQVERITQYDTLAAALTDLGFSQYVCQSRYMQGLGFSNHNSHLKTVDTYTGNLQNSFQGPGTTNNVLYMSSIVQPNYFNPTRTGQYPLNFDTQQGPNSNQQINNAINLQQGSASNFDITNYLYFNWDGYVTSSGTPAVNTMNYFLNTYLGKTGKALNVRVEYQPNVALRQQVDSTTSTVCTQFYLPVGLITTSSLSNGTGIQSGMLYQPIYPQNTENYITWIDTTTMGMKWSSVQLPNTAQNTGYARYNNGLYDIGCYQPTISATLPQCQFAYGQILPQPVPVSQRIFKVPLLSSIIGVLIPPQQYSLIPMAALYNMLIQLTLNPYAMFTSGYQDIHQYDTQGMQKQISRFNSWVYSNVQYNMHIYDFPDQDLKQYLQTSLTKQIYISSVSWSLSAQYQLPNGQAVRNNWTINTTAQSLGQVMIIFLSNQYQKYSFCRKQFRLTNNITQFYLKFGTDFYPPQPITGNAGNPQYYDNTGTNASFYELIQLSRNYLFNTNSPNPRINIRNFAINGRCYNVANQQSYYPPNTYRQVTNTNLSAALKINTDTALGACWGHQNRYVGRGMFIFSWQPFGHSKQFQMGVDASITRPFQIMFNNAATNYFPTDQTMYVFTKANVIIKYGNDGIRVIGR